MEKNQKEYLKTKAKCNNPIQDHPMCSHVERQITTVIAYSLTEYLESDCWSNIQHVWDHLTTILWTLPPTPHPRTCHVLDCRLSMSIEKHEHSGDPTRESSISGDLMSSCDLLHAWFCQSVLSLSLSLPFCLCLLNMQFINFHFPLNCILMALFHNHFAHWSRRPNPKMF